MSNPYELHYRSLHIPVNSSMTKHDTEIIAIHLGMIYNTLGGVIKDLVLALSYKFQEPQQIQFLQAIPKLNKLNPHQIVEKETPKLNCKNFFQELSVKPNPKIKQVIEMDVEQKSFLQQFKYKPSSKQIITVVNIQTPINQTKNNKQIDIVNIQDDEEPPSPIKNQFQKHKDKNV